MQRELKGLAKGATDLIDQPTGQRTDIESRRRGLLALEHDDVTARNRVRTTRMEHHTRDRARWWCSRQRRYRGSNRGKRPSCGQPDSSAACPFHPNLPFTPRSHYWCRGTAIFDVNSRQEPGTCVHDRP